MKKHLTLFICLIATIICKAEIYFIYSLDELMSRSSIILKTEFQCQMDDQYLFTTIKSDSVYINQSQMIYFHNSPAKKYYNYVKEENPCTLYDGIWQSSACFLFIEKIDYHNNVKLVSSGIKIIKDDELYSQKYDRPSDFFRLDSPHNFDKVHSLEVTDLSIIIKSWQSNNSWQLTRKSKRSLYAF